MLAVDTNVIVRILTADDSRQTALAKAAFESGEIFIAKTVLLEADWVLRRVYRLDAATVRQSLLSLLGLENVSVEDPEAIRTAVALVHQGLDFADALHLASRPPNAHFLSFDRDLVRRAKRAGSPAVSSLPL